MPAHKRSTKGPAFIMAPRPKIVIVNDKMQRGYRYDLVAPMGRKFDPEFCPDLQGVARAWHLRRQIHDRLPRRISGKLVRARQACSCRPRLLTQLFWCRRQPAAINLAREGVDSSGRSARVVPVVLPLLHGPAFTGGGRAPDQTVESNSAACRPGQTALRAGRPDVSTATTTGVAALGLRQPDDLSGIYETAKHAIVEPSLSLEQMGLCFGGFQKRKL